MKIAILHDYLHTYGGAERVLKTILSTFPDAPLYSSCFYPSVVPLDLSNRETHFSSLNKLPLNKVTKEIISKFSFNVFKEFDLSSYDVLICSTSGPSNWIKVNDSQRIYSFFHKIPSFEFKVNKDISEEDKEQAKNNSKNLLSNIRDNFSFIDKEFAKADQKYVKRINQIISNSKHYSKNFKKIYDKEAIVIYPSIDKGIKEFIEVGPQSPKEDYYVFLGRLEEYKGIRFIIEACIKEDKKLVIIGDGSIRDSLPKHPNIIFSRDLSVSKNNMVLTSDNKKYEILSKAKALINGSKEDFGIIFPEALALKTPIITLRGGGIHEISNDRNVVYFDNRNADSVIGAIKEFESKNIVVSDSDQNEILNRFSESEFIKNLLQVVK